MDENILIYDVKSGDTLEKIGDKIGMTGEQLKDFHNSHCQKMEKLWFDNLMGVRQIIIPKEYKSPEEQRIERERELPPSSVTRDFYANSYSVKETFSNFSGVDVELDYKIDIYFKSKKETNSPDEIVDVRCHDFKKNGSRPDDKMSAISIACMESIYPISFIIPYQGKISGIYESEKLKKKFEAKKTDLESFFIGEIYHSYLEKFHESLGNQNQVLKQFSSSLLYQIFFPKMEWFHKLDIWTEGFHFLQNSLLLNCSMSAKYNHEDTEVVETLLQGTTTETLSLQEILRGVIFDDESEEFADGEIQILYSTDKMTKKMLSAEASVTFRNDDELYRKQSLKLTCDE